MANTFYPTAHKAAADSYPYGYKKTTAYFGTEFHPKKGFRTTFQTVNPSTGRLNAVKYSTYSPVYLMYRDEATGHYKHTGVGIFGSDEETNKAADFCALHFDLFTLTELAYIYANFCAALKVSMVGSIQYCGSDVETIRALYQEARETALKGYKAAAAGERLNIFAQIKVDAEAVDATHVKDYNPFRTTTVYKIDGNGMHEVTPAEAEAAGFK